ncbi:growth hormone secretagogue receptor type 1-like [Elysia marginata]|uniref:Growth hormone secretagogue receptor type 1-like n=1 Tax=Elysia marginata TaxID=1093978 RepID=A0AAV4IAW4_9GAST|nr:growth hormone secretagogue receptor type 1-like [Elysia marginata]
MDKEGSLRYDVENRSDLFSKLILSKENNDAITVDPEKPTAWKAPSLPTYVAAYVTLANILIFLAGTTGNVMVIVVVTRVRDMRSSINLYLVNLSIADLLVLLVCQPTALLEFYAKDRWFLGQALCVTIPVLEHTVLHASILTVVFITFERYLAICRPHSGIRLSSDGEFIFTIICIWLGAGLTSLPFLDMTSLKESTFYDGSPCKVCKTVLSKPWHTYYIVGTTTGFGVLPVIMLACFYVPIICRLRAKHGLSKETGRVSLTHADNTSSKRLQRSAALFSGGYRLRSHRQVIRMLLLIVVFLFLALVPMRVLALWQVLGPPGSTLSLGIEGYYNLIWLCRMLMYTNSAINPLIYSLLSTRFKIAFRLVLRCQSHVLNNVLNNRNQNMMTRRTALRLEVRSAFSTGSVSGHQHYPVSENSRGTTENNVEPL